MYLYPLRKEKGGDFTRQYDLAVNIKDLTQDGPFFSFLKRLPTLLSSPVRIIPNLMSMDPELLKTVSKVAGIGGIALCVVLLVFQDVIRKNIFPMLTKDHAYRIIR